MKKVFAATLLASGAAVAPGAAHACGHVTIASMNRAPAPVKTVVTAAFRKAGGPAFDYLTRRQLTIDTINKFLARGADNQANGEATARHVLKENADVWTKWVSADVADKVRKAL